MSGTMPACWCAKPFQERGRRGPNASLALHGLDDDGGGVFADGLARRIEVVPGTEADAGDEWLERLAVLRGPGERERAHRPAVEGALECDEGRAARRLADPPCELDRGFHRFGPGVAEEDPGRERQRHQPIRQRGACLRVVEVARVDELAGLLADGRDDLAVAVAKAVDTHSGGEVEVLPSLAVKQIRAAA
jgi:hypothetical protein